MTDAPSATSAGVEPPLGRTFSRTWPRRGRSRGLTTAAATTFDETASTEPISPAAKKPGVDPRIVLTRVVPLRPEPGDEQDGDRAAAAVMPGAAATVAGARAVVGDELLVSGGVLGRSIPGVLGPDLR
jgi:hypothetical protein